MEGKWWMQIERTCMLLVSSYKLVSIFLAFNHKDTETETKKKVLLPFGYLTRKPQSYFIRGFFGIRCSLTYVRLSACKNHSKIISTSQAFKLGRTNLISRFLRGRDGYTSELHEKKIVLINN